MSPEVIAWLGPAFTVLKWLGVAAVPLLSLLWTMFWNKQLKQDATIEKLKEDKVYIEKELQRETTELRERIIKLESTSVTNEQLRVLLKDVTRDMEERFGDQIRELKEFMTQLIRAEKQ
jgi:predicted nucleic acid-binding OB-fold protein